MTRDQRLARAGARYLDRKFGRRWRRWIRRRDLSMAVGVYSGPGDCGCILAQIDYHLHGNDSRNGNYQRLAIELGLLDESTATSLATFRAFDGSVETDAWLEELRAS